MNNFHIKHTLLSRTYQFLTRKQFTDCILKDGNNTFPAHRLILSQRSTFFKSYFENHPQNDGNYQIDLPFNDQNIIKLAIDFMYSQTIVVNMKNIMPVIKASDVYGIDDLRTRAFAFLKKELTNQPDITFLRIVKEFANLDLVYIFLQQDECIERLAGLLINADMPSKLHQIFDSITPLILAKALKCYRFNDPKIKIDKILIIDRFTNFYVTKKIEESKEKTNQIKELNLNSILSNEEKLALESVFTWEETDFKRFLHYKCDWVSDSTSRNCINSIINNRRNIIKNFESEIQNNSSKADSNKWYTFIWTSAIANSVLVDKSPEVNIISFLNTLGNYIDNQNAINPGRYRLIEVNSTPAMDKHFDPTNAIWLNEKKYYLSNIIMNGSSKDAQPFYSFNLGESVNFEITELIIESNIPRCKDGKRQFPDIVRIEGITCQNQITKPVYEKIKYGDEGKCSANLHFDSPISQIKITMIGEERNGGNFLRIKFIDAKGHFI